MKAGVGVWRYGIQIPEFGACSGMFGFGVTIFAIAVAIALAVASIVWLTHGRERDAVQLYETKLRMLCALVFVLSISAAEVAGGIKVLCSTKDVYGLLLALAVFLFLSSPLFAAVWAYARIPSNLKNEYMPQPITAASNDCDLVALTADLSYQLGLRTPPMVVVSGRPIMWPFVAGRARRTCHLVCPAGLRGMLGSLARKVGANSNSCLRFVLLHELSHIRHGDGPFICWAYYFRTALKKWLIIGFLLWPLYYGACTLWSSQANTDDILFMKLAGGLLLVLLVNLGFLSIFSFLCSSVQRQREFHADGRAWLHMLPPGAEGQQDAGKSARMLLASLAHGVLKAARGGSGFAEWAGWSVDTGFYRRLVNRLPEAMREFASRIIAGHPRAEERIKFVESLPTASEKAPFLTDEAAFWSGVNVGLISCLGGAIALLLSNPSSFVQRGLFAALLATAAVYGATVLALPVKESIRSLPVKAIVKGTGRALIMMSLGYVVVSSCSGFLFFKFTPIIFCFTLGLGAVFVGGAYSSRQSSFVLEPREARVALYDIPGILLWVTSMVALAFWLRERWYCVALAFFPGTIIGYVFSVKGPYRHYGSLQDMNMAAVWGKHLVTKTEGRTFGLSLVAWRTLAILLVLGIPCACFSTLYLLLDDSTGVISQGLGGASLVSFTLMVLPVVAVGYVLGRVRPPLLSTSLQQMGACAEVLREVANDGADAESVPTELKAIGLSLFSPVIDGRLVPAHIEYVHNACRTLDALGALSPYLKNKAAKRALNCECDAGGFGVWEGSLPRLSATYWALSILNMCSALDTVSQDKHAKWIASCHQPSHLYRSELSRRPPLEDTFFALRSLSFLRATDGVDGDRCSGAIIQDWRVGRRDERRTYWCVKSLEALGRLESPVREELRDAWLLPQRVAAQSLRIDTCISWVSHYVGIVAALEKAGALAASEFIPESWRKSAYRLLERQLDDLRRRSRRYAQM